MNAILLTEKQLTKLNSLETVAVLGNGTIFKAEEDMVHALWQRPHGQGWATLGKFNSVKHALKNIHHGRFWK